MDATPNPLREVKDAFRAFRGLEDLQGYRFEFQYGTWWIRHRATGAEWSAVATDQGINFDIIVYGTDVIPASFRAKWKRLARLGKCDSWGGAECRRVCREWLDAGRPGTDPFVIIRANAGPTGSSAEKN